MGIGKPHHYIDANGVSACGIVHPEYATTDPKKCNCDRCRNTQVFKQALARQQRWEAGNDPRR
jgi:hypothetical protein